MTLKEAKAAVKKKYPSAVCCTIWEGHWHLVVKTRRNGEALCDPISVTSGNQTDAWKRAAVELAEVQP